MVSVVPVLMWALALACAGIAVARGPRPVTGALIADRLVRYLFVFPIGLLGLWAFVGHVFFAEETARSIGWQPSPFQYEVGVANLGIGLAGFYAAFRGYEARMAAALVALCFLGGAGIGHIRQIAETGNMAAGNAGPILVTDFATPLAIFGLLLFLRGRSARAGRAAGMAG